MTLQNFVQPLVLVAASGCKCGGCMTLQKSAFRWLHEPANWHRGERILASKSPDRTTRYGHASFSVRRVTAPIGRAFHWVLFLEHQRIRNYSERGSRFGI